MTGHRVDLLPRSSNRTAQHVDASQRKGEKMNLDAAWTIAHSPTASLEDIFFCFRLLLGRSPGEKEWPGHSSFQGEKLETVVKAYLGSLEFANRRLLSKESISGIQVAKCGDFLIYCDPNDLAVGKYVLSNAYEPRVTQLNDPRQSRGHIPVSPSKGPVHEPPEGDISAGSMFSCSSRASSASCSRMYFLTASSSNPTVET